MNDINPTKFDSLTSNIDDIAIAIKLVNPDPRQNHLGLFLKPEEGKSPKLLHLAWHNEFCYDSKIDDGYYYLSTCKNVEKSVVEDFVDWLDNLWKVNGEKIAYSLLFDVSGKAFDDEGLLLNNELGQGFTCSTFVLECFKCYGFQLIKYDTWPKREEDKVWKEKIFYALEFRTDNVDPEHVNKQRNMGDITRYRPEEVAVAANMHDFEAEPLGFNDIEPYSNDLVRRIS